VSQASAAATRFVPDAADPRSHQGPLLAIVALALLASVTGLANGFAYDDRWIIADNPNAHDLAHWWNAFSQTYWPAMRNAALYRPFTIIAYQLQWAAGGGTPLLFHTINVMLYAAVSALVYLLAAQVLPRGGAWVAAALFAVHPVHVEAVGNVVGQAELWSAAAIIGAMVVYLRARRGGMPIDRQAGIIVAGLYFGGMMFKENAIVLPALLVAAEGLVVADDRPWRVRADELARLLVWIGLLAALFLAVRVVVTGEIGGDVEHPALRTIGATQRAWVMLGLAPEFARLLIWPARLYADYSPQMVSVHTSPHPDHITGALLLLCIAILAVVSVRRFPLVTFAVAWSAITFLPVANLLIPTGILIAERTLFLPSVGAVLAAGSLVPWCLPRITALRREWRLVATGAFAALLTAGFSRSAERQYAWKDTATVFKTLAADAPFSFKAHYANGGMLWETGHGGEAEREWRAAIYLFPGYFGVYQDLAHRYREAHLCPAAVPLYHKALEIEPSLPYSRIGLAACHLELAEFRKARAEARVAIADGMYRKAFEYIINRADSALVATDSLDGANRWKPATSISGQPPGKPSRTATGKPAPKPATKSAGKPLGRNR